MEASNLKFLHFRTTYTKKDVEELLKDEGPIPSQAVSVGYKVVETPTPDGAVHFHLEGQVAKCCMKDVFNKKIARAIIEGRYKKRGPAFKIDLADDWTQFEVYKTLEMEFHPDIAWDSMVDARLELED